MRLAASVQPELFMPAKDSFAFHRPLHCLLVRGVLDSHCSCLCPSPCFTITFQVITHTLATTASSHGTCCTSAEQPSVLKGGLSDNYAATQSAGSKLHHAWNRCHLREARQGAWLSSFFTNGVARTCQFELKAGYSQNLRCGCL